MPGTGRKTMKTKKVFCAQCKLEANDEKEECIECDKCAKTYHAMCTKLDKKQYEHLLHNEEEDYVCHKCNVNDGVNSATVTEQLLRMEAKLNKLDQLTESMNFLSSKFDDLMNGISANKKKIDNVEKENFKLKNEIKTLKDSVKMLNDQRVKNDCIVNGIKTDEGVTAVNAVLKLSEAVGVSMNEANIEEAYFLKKRNTTNPHQSLVVKFSSKTSKNKLMEAKSKLKDNDNTKNVYINDFLSKESMELFNYAKTLKTVGYNFVYTNGNRIYVKKSSITRPKLIQRKEDVDEILLQATTNTFQSRRSLRKLPPPVDDSDDNEADAQGEFLSPNQL